MDKSMSFPKRLQQALDELGWNQSELARRMGVKPQSVQGWLKNVIPRMDKLKKLSEVTGKPLDWFFSHQLQNQEKKSYETFHKEKNTLTEKQKLILELFEALPESDVNLILKELEIKKTFYEKKIAELLNQKKNIV
ncbi:helix-turn-helix domain-containing protein [Arsenophonus endosymbiont of Aleurodicus floccissimus]|uniref:helix-turn-helix domain-containing protein n=1 Tax=Arsenophonus endosymbiont of Aleurodicus floccissimus TaxID=2152761 RepID=UPI001EDF8E2B|nr:helix-turn-helix domain-containing protein [Arsenophonus endosymbiont of Aleurodicus floccissimus]